MMLAGILMSGCTRFWVSNHSQPDSQTVFADCSELFAQAEDRKIFQSGLVNQAQDL